jgi:hypothetical protein
MFDHIYVLHQGVVAAEGSFHELRANSPVFAELWRHQEELSRESGIGSRESRAEDEDINDLIK